MIKPTKTENGKLTRAWLIFLGTIQPGFRFWCGAAIMLLLDVKSIPAEQALTSSSEKVLSLQIQVDSESNTNQELHLRGSDARHQTLITARHDSGKLSD